MVWNAKSFCIVYQVARVASDVYQSTPRMVKGTRLTTHCCPKTLDGNRFARYVGRNGQERTVKWARGNSSVKAWHLRMANPTYGTRTATRYKLINPGFRDGTDGADTVGSIRTLSRAGHVAYNLPILGIETTLIQHQASKWLDIGRVYTQRSPLEMCV